MATQILKETIKHLERVCSKFEEQGNSFAFNEAFVRLEKARKELKDANNR